MAFTKNYINLITRYKSVVACPVDPQVLLLCKNSESIPLDTILGQFKWCVTHKQYGVEYGVLRQYLMDVFGRQTINELEVIS